MSVWWRCVSSGLFLAVKCIRMTFGPSRDHNCVAENACSDEPIRYLVYGEEEWKAQAFEALEQLNCFDPQTKVEFKQTLNWLHEHAVRPAEHIIVCVYSLEL